MTLSSMNRKEGLNDRPFNDKVLEQRQGTVVTEEEEAMNYNYCRKYQNGREVQNDTEFKIFYRPMILLLLMNFCADIQSNTALHALIRCQMDGSMKETIIQDMAKIGGRELLLKQRGEDGGGPTALHLAFRG